MDIVTETLSTAQQYMELGWHLVILHGLRGNARCTCKKNGDCPHPGKHPRFPKWQDNTASDIETLEQQFAAKRNSNLGVQLGPKSSLIDIEFDCDEGRQKIDSLFPSGVFVPTYRSARSIHRLFLWDNSLPAIGSDTFDGIEFRLGNDGTARQSVLPPSRHGSGCRYEWLPGLGLDDVPLEPLPDPLRELLRQHTAGPGGGLVFTMNDDSETLQTHPGAREGQRNKTLCRLIGRYIRQHGIDADLIPTAYAWAERCKPAMPTGEVSKLVADIAAKESAKAQATPQAKGTQPPLAAPRTITLRPLSSITPQPVEWLWPLRLPIGKLSILGGDGGCGKTTLACDIASRLSTGEALPQGAAGEPVESLIVTAEDGAGDTIRTRIEACGGNLDRVFVIDADCEVTDFRQSVAGLAAAIEQRPAIKLVIFDTLPDFVGAADDYKNSELRQALRPVLKLAETMGVAVVGICHFGKGGGAKSSTRLLGSVAYVNVARSVLYLVHDKDTPGRRILWHEKSNLGPMADALAFTLEQDEHNPHSPARIAWEAGPVFIDDITPYIDAGGKRPRSKEKKAADWLITFLASGPRPASEALEAGEAAGHKRSVLYRAADSIGTVKQDGIWSLMEGITDSIGTFTFS